MTMLIRVQRRGESHGGKNEEYNEKEDFLHTSVSICA